MDPKDGVYVGYPVDELYAVLTIEAHRANAVIVGEDLGAVPQYVPAMMDKHGVHRMYVVQYELKPQGSIPRASRRSTRSPASIRTTCRLSPVIRPARTSTTGSSRDYSMPAKPKTSGPAASVP